MESPPSDLPPPDSRQPEPGSSASFSHALFVAGLATVLYGAILVAIDGFVSLLTDTDVISEPDAGPIVGPVMAVAALSVLFVSLVGGLRPTHGPRRVPIVRAIVTGLLIVVVSPLAGAIVYVSSKDQVVSGMLFFGKYLSSPFVVASAVLAVVCVLLLPLIAITRSRAR